MTDLFLEDFRESKVVRLKVLVCSMNMKCQRIVRAFAMRLIFMSKEACDKDVC